MWNLGLMFWDIDYSFDGNVFLFFDVELCEGIMDVFDLGVTKVRDGEGVIL